METVVLPPRDQFTLEYEKHNRKLATVQYNGNNPETQRRRTDASSALLKPQIFNDKIPQKQFSPVSYGILPPPTNHHLQFPIVNDLQFMPANNLPFPPGNNSQFCSVNGVQASPLYAFRDRPGRQFSPPSPECEIPKNNGVYGLPHPPLFPYQSPSPATLPSTQPSLGPQISSTLTSFPAGNPAESEPRGRRWHSMPEGCLSCSPSVVGAQEIPNAGRGAPLFRSRSATIPPPRSPEHGVFPEWHHPSCPPNSVNGGFDDHKRTRPWQIGKEVDNRSPKPLFEWKLVDSGTPKSQNEGRFGPEKQFFTASHKPTSEKKNIVKKVVTAVKSGGGRSKNARESSSDGKGITVLKRPPKSEFAVKNFLQSAVTNVKDGKKYGGEADVDGSTSNARPDGDSNILENEFNNYDAGIDCGKCNNPQNKGRDHEYGMHCDCDIEERILFKPDFQGHIKKESGESSASFTPEFNGGGFQKKESGQISQAEDKESGQISRAEDKVSTDTEAVENFVDPQVDSKGGLVLEAMGSLSIDDGGKEVCALPRSAYVTENWAGPAYVNSPPPSSLPFPRFPMREMRSASLDLPPNNNDDFGDAVISSGSHSAPPSPTRDAPESRPLSLPRGKLQIHGFSVDADSATKDLRRMLNLDFNA